MPLISVSRSARLHRILEPQARDFFNFSQRGRVLFGGGMMQPGFHGLHNRLSSVESRTDDKGETKPLSIGVIQTLEFCQLCRAECIESGTGLFAGGFRGELVLLREATGEIRMRTNEIKLLLARSGLHRGAELRVQLRQIPERPLHPGSFRDPRGMFEKMPQRRRERGLVELVELLKRHDRVI